MTLATLQIGPAQTTLTIGPRQVLIALGTTALARAHFKRWPPTPLEMENAISVVEDALAAARGDVPDPLRLETTDAGFGVIAASAGVQAELPLALDRDAVERAFNWLVDIAEGAPATAPAPDPLEWAARLVILREMMHHWSIASVRVHR